MNATVAVAIVAALGSVVAAVVAARTAERGKQVETTATESAQALGAWKDLLQPLRDENARLQAEMEAERAEHVAVLTALSNENDRLRSKLKRLEGK